MSRPYVALGDSYSAGVGGGDKRDDCFHGPRGYPPLLARRLGLDLAYVACDGAVIDSLRATQLGALGESTELVTLTIGGNDAGFAPVLIKAASPWWLADGPAAIRAARAIIDGPLPARLVALYREVRGRAPGARVLVADYPRLFDGEDCQVLTFFDAEELRLLDETADALSARIAQAAEEAGVEHVAVAEAFAGHAICDEAPYLNGLIVSVRESFHPNLAGHAAYAELFEAQVGPRPAALPGAPKVEYGATERGPAPPFVLPALTSDVSLARAEAAGLDPRQVRDLGARLSRFWNDGIEAPVREGPQTVAPEATAAEQEAAAELRGLSERARRAH